MPPSSSHSRRSLDKGPRCSVRAAPLLLRLPMASWPPTPDDLARLRDTLAWVHERSPYYRRLFDGAGVLPAELRTYDQFRTRVPRLEKTELVANQPAHPPFGELLAARREEFSSLHTSPGPIYIPRLA